MDTFHSTAETFKPENTAVSSKTINVVLWFSFSPSASFFNAHEFTLTLV